MGKDSNCTGGAGEEMLTVSCCSHCGQHSLILDASSPGANIATDFISGLLPPPGAHAQRHNQGKTDLSLLPVEACAQEALVWGFGANKYGRANWKKLWGDDTINVAMASLMRHAFAVLNGELEDSESGLPHAAHIRCNAAMILEYQKQLREKK